MTDVSGGKNYGKNKWKGNVQIGTWDQLWETQNRSDNLELTQYYPLVFMWETKVERWNVSPMVTWLVKVIPRAKSLGMLPPKLSCCFYHTEIYSLIQHLCHFFLLFPSVLWPPWQNSAKGSPCSNSQTTGPSSGSCFLVCVQRTVTQWLNFLNRRN